MKKSMNVEINIPNKSEFVAVARLAISGVAGRMNFSIEDIEDIKIAFSEACNNAVQYAFDTDDEIVNIVCEMFEDKLNILVIDKGKGFDYEKVINQKPVEATNDKLGLGLGLTFIKSLMDDMEVKSVIGQGTIVTMTKSISN
jgi:serine/threonine-protein kinase RsbW